MLYGSELLFGVRRRELLVRVLRERLHDGAYVSRPAGDRLVDQKARLVFGQRPRDKHRQALELRLLAGGQVFAPALLELLDGLPAHLDGLGGAYYDGVVCYRLSLVDGLVLDF